MRMDEYLSRIWLLSSLDMVLYKSSMKSGAELYFPCDNKCGRGLCGSPRTDRISFCISLFSCVRSRRCMKPACASTFPSTEKLLPAVNTHTQALKHNPSRASRELVMVLSKVPSEPGLGVLNREKQSVRNGNQSPPETAAVATTDQKL